MRNPKRYTNEMVWGEPDVITNPRPGLCQVFLDYWWVVNDQGQVALWENEFPQCNMNRSIAQRLGLGYGTDVVKIPVAFLPHNCEY